MTLLFRPKEQHVALEDEDGRLVAAAGLVVAEVEVAGARFPVAGLGGVIVRADQRGRRLARRVVESALDRARGLGPDFMMLFCLPDRVGLYLRLEFSEVAEEVLVEQPGGAAPMPLRTMWRALRAGSQWPPGSVSLRSLPF